MLEVGQRLGAGSFGVVWEAFDRYRNRTVALKVLERVSAETVARFKREFRYLAEIRHPNPEVAIEFGLLAVASILQNVVLEEQTMGLHTPKNIDEELVRLFARRGGANGGAAA